MLVQVCTDELEDVEVEVVSRDHGLQPEFRLLEVMIDAAEGTAIGRCRKPCRCETEDFTL